MVERLNGIERVSENDSKLLHTERLALTMAFTGSYEA
jgi:hypothetical protein